MKILIVDDFSTMRRIIKNLLRDLGFTNTAEADDGTSALPMLQSGSFDFLVRTSNGKLALGDLKTVSSDKAVSQRQPAKAQLGGYLAMLIDHHPELSVDSCYTLVSGPGRYRLIKSEPDECLMEWIGAWDAFKLINAPF